MMTTTARTRNMNLRIATWNINSWRRKEYELIIELNNHKIDICAISETKKKGKGTTTSGNYTLIYSGVHKSEYAHAGTGMLIHNKWANKISDIIYVNERILVVLIQFHKLPTYFISVYAPDVTKPRVMIEQFYNDLQDTIDAIPNKNQIVLMGDFNARIGDSIIPGITQRYNETASNPSGEIMLDFCSYNELRINNTFFPHKPQHKITWSNSRGQSSIIDYVVTNRGIHPEQIKDVRTLTSANIGTDHGLVLCKLNLDVQLKKRTTAPPVEKLNIESIETPSTKELYKTRLENRINGINTENISVEEMWRNIKSNIVSSAEEVLGKRKTRQGGKKKNKTPWFTEAVKDLAVEKKKAFLTFKQNQTPDEYSKYVVVRNRVNAQIHKIKEEHWEGFTKGMEHDLYGAQRKVWKMIQNQKKEINEYINNTNISKTQWVEHFRNIYTHPSPTTDRTIHSEVLQSNNNEEAIISLEEVQEAIRRLKNRKSPGPDNIHNELLKYGGENLHEILTVMFNKILQEGKVPTEWKDSITVPIFKKGDKKTPDNYRGITLLNTTLKCLTSIINNKLQKHIATAEEQQGFRKNRSTVDAIFILRQIIEKAIEFNTPAFMCFVDLTKAFDRVRKEDVVQILIEEKVPQPIIDIIIDINSGNTTKIQTNQGLTETINVLEGIRQGDSLSPFLFNIIMNKIIDAVKKRNGYKIDNKNLTILCYADDAVLIADNEDDLQRQLKHFDTTASLYNMKISTGKTKCMVVSREPVRCKLEMNGAIIEQVMSFNYLGVEITSDRNLGAEVLKQTNKAIRIAGCLRDTIWKNKYMTAQSKVKIYKTMVRPIITYATETRAETKKTKQKMRTAEMKILRSISGVTLRDRQTNKSVRERCSVQDVVKWTKVRKREWNEHVDRMDEGRLAKICKIGRPKGRRPPGRPPKRWAQSWFSSSTD